jgi:DNA polymerase-3 subunit beta
MVSLEGFERTDAFSPRPTRRSAARVLHINLTPKTFTQRYNAVLGLAARRFPKAILQTVQLEATGEGRGILRVTDFEAWAEVDVRLAKVIEPGVVQLPEQFPKLLKDAAKCPSVRIEEVPVETIPAKPDPNARTRKIVVETRASTSVLATFDPELFPTIPEERAANAVEIASWRLARLIRRTQFAVDEDSTRYALGGMALEADGGQLHLIATDGRRLAHAFEPAAGALAPAVGTEEHPLAPVVPRKALRALATMLDAMDPMGVRLGFTEGGRLVAEAKGLRLAARQIEGRFPSWRQAIPEERSATRARVRDLPRLAKALREAQKLTTKSYRAMKVTLNGHVVRLDVENDEATSST